ncbi:MAG: NADH-quinone oxidoreductase subunit J [Candidatus Promineifilaceae bacterium]|nr:NADH-quinone oxidoreductase subunit J [Candidatus Promineifilaceae bacterium]
MGNPLLFLFLAVIAVAAALGMLLSRNAVHSALFLVLNFATIAVFYIVLNAPFIAMVQVIVYAGAIVVLFLFVIMLLGAERLRALGTLSGADRWQRILAGLLALALVTVTIVALLQGDGAGSETIPLIDSSPTALGLELFSSYLLPFEVTGVLLLAAMIGVVVLGMTKKRGEDA